MVRSAFSLIELIFAIVVIGIGLMSMPLITSVNSDSMKENIVQEGIFAVSTQVVEYSSFSWDENSRGHAGSTYSSVLDVATGDSDFRCMSDGKTPDEYRVGHVKSSANHRRCYSVGDADRSETPIGLEAGAGKNADIDDANGAAGTPFTGTVTSSRGYKYQYKAALAVKYVSDKFASGNTVILGTGKAGTDTNLKLIEITLTYQNPENTAEWLPITTLRTYSANIGEVPQYAYRNF